MAGLGIMAVFYTAYFTKMLLQRHRGIRTDQMSRGGKPERVLRVERWLKCATVCAAGVEVLCIAGNYRMQTPSWLGWAGICVGCLGTLVFLLAMAQMRDSWRAGIPAEDKTELVTGGIYQFSRNPAFLGFDLVYFGLLAAFFSPVHLVFALFAVRMLHLQILQEEAYLAEVFADDYLQYKTRTGRYFRIRKNGEVR